MIRLLLTGISGEFSGNFRVSRRSFKLLVRILWLVGFFLIIFKFVSSSSIYNNYYFLIIFQARSFMYCTYMSPKTMSLAHCSNFFLSNLIHNLQTTLISTKYSQKNKNNNIKLNSTSTVPQILLQRAIRLQNKLTGKSRL